MFETNIIIYSILVIPYTILYIKKYKLTPVSVFLVMEISYFYGICFAPKGQLPVSIKLETIYVIAMACYILGVEFGKRVVIKKSRNRYLQSEISITGSFTDSELSKNQLIAIWGVIIVAVLACAYLFAAGGVNVFLRSLVDFFSGSSATYKRERASYFGVSGMGYIYQFRAILLPILTVYVCFCDKKKLPKIIAIPLMILMVLFLLGTGQRNAFVFFCLVVLMYAVTMRYRYGISTFSRGQIIVFGCAALLFLVTLTISNGRVESDGNQVAGALQSLVDRVFSVNQKTAITAFTYIDTQPTCWGYDWFMTLRDILPGKSGYLTVSRITYYISYGTYNGTGDPCIWGSAWYNFHILGITMFPFLLGIAYHHVYRTMVSKKDKNRLYMMIYSGLSVYFGLWIYGTPMNLFNIGVVALFILRWLIFTVLRKPVETQIEA